MMGDNVVPRWDVQAVLANDVACICAGEAFSRCTTWSVSTVQHTWRLPYTYTHETRKRLDWTCASISHFSETPRVQASAIFWDRRSRILKHETV